MQKICSKSTYLKKNNLKIFNEIDERNKSLFVSLTYPHEIHKRGCNNNQR